MQTHHLPHRRPPHGRDQVVQHGERLALQDSPRTKARENSWASSPRRSDPKFWTAMAGCARSYPTIRNSIGADLCPTDPVPTQPVWLRPNPAQQPVLTNKINTFWMSGPLTGPQSTSHSPSTKSYLPSRMACGRGAAAVRRGLVSHAAREGARTAQAGEELRQSRRPVREGIRDHHGRAARPALDGRRVHLRAVLQQARPFGSNARQGAGVPGAADDAVNPEANPAGIKKQPQAPEDAARPQHHPR